VSGYTDQELAAADLPQLRAAARIVRADIIEADKEVQIAYAALSAAQVKRRALLDEDERIATMIRIHRLRGES
jgi:hypothetical protein